jgi:hypothetical protein
VTVEFVGPAPAALATMTVYAAPICPCVKFPEWLLVMLSDGGGLTMPVTSFDVEFTEFATPSLDTSAVFVTVGGSLPATFTVSVSAG